MLTAGKSTTVKFNVNVMGTSAEPTVRLILGTNPELNFRAEKIGNEWSANLNVPDWVQAGSYNLKAEVLLNQRMFTPLTKVVQIEANASSPVEPREEPVKEVPAATEPRQAPREVKSILQSISTSTIEAVQSQVKTPKRKFESVRTPLPDPKTKSKKAPLQVRISDIDAAASPSVVKIEPLQQEQKVVKPRTVAKLVKEHLFYE